jgi:hypothetical protein
MKYIILFTLLFSLNSFAQGTDDPFRVKPDKSYSHQDVKEQKEILLLEDSILEDIDKVVGLKNTDHFTKWDNTRLSINYHTTVDITKIQTLSSFDIKFSRKMQHFTGLWWSFLAKKTFANFDAVSENPTPDAAADPSSDRFPNNARPATSKQDILQVGLGLSYRFKFILPWREVKNFFEEIHVLLSAVSHTEGFSKLDYSGYGLIVEYEIYKRSSKKFFYGGKLSYNIADVTREVPSALDLNDGRLLLSWMSLGFNMGFYF